MRSAILLTQLAIWASTTHAFFPYRPKWVEEEEDARRSLDGRSAGVKLDIKQRAGQNTAPSPERVAREASRLAEKYDRRRTSSPASARPAKRDNQFPIMKADDSGDKLTAGISQDGTDYSYFVQVQLGSKGREFYLLVDTGAGSSWVMGSDCDTDACSLHNTFGPDESSTLKTTSDDFSISYGSGTVKGKLATDSITLAGMSFDYKFGVASDTSDDFSHYAFDGILGFSMGDGASDNFLKVMSDAKEVDNNMFCIALNRAADGTNTGEIRFGSTDPDKFTGDISYTETDNNEDWAIKIDDMAYDGSKANVGNSLAYIDTGTSFIFGSAERAKAIHSVIPGSKSSDGQTYSVPCDSEKSLTVTFSGVDYEVSPKDWISPVNLAGQCTSNIYGYEVVKGAWLLGDTFLKNVYSVFDKDKTRIGFAPIAGGNSTSSSTSADSSSATETASSTMTDVTSATATATATTVKPSMGLGGHETKGSTATAAAQTSKPTDDKHSSACGSYLTNVKYASVVGLVTLFALLA